MSTVSIQYGLRTFKCKVTPSMPTSEILNSASAHFHLAPPSYGLFHNKTELSTALPYRLHNLPQGAKLTLLPSSKKNKTEQEITIKIQFINNPSLSKSSVVKKVLNTITLRELTTALEQEVGEFLNKGLVIKFISMSRTVGADEGLGMDLNQIGVENNGILRVSFTDPSFVPKPREPQSIAPSKQTAKPTPTPTRAVETTTTTTTTTTEHPPPPQPLPVPEFASKAEPIVQKQEVHEPQPLPTPVHPVISSIKPIEPPAEPKEQEKHVYVYKPATTALPTVTPDDSTYEVDVDAARQYQNMIHLRATETDRARKIRLSKQKHLVNNVECRIRFPDGSTIQVNFKPEESCSNLYEFVQGVLVNGNDGSADDFYLIIPHPKTLIPNDRTKMVNCLNSRNLLLFQPKSTGKKYVLKKEYLDQAKDITEAEDVKLDHKINGDGDEQMDSTLSGPTIQSGHLPKKGLFNSSPSSSSSSATGGSGKKIPKWLKLGK